MLAATILIVLAPHLVRILAPTQSVDTVEAVALVLQFLALGLVPLGASVLVKQAYFALEDGRSVFLIHIPMALAWIGIAFWVRANAEPQWWVPGVALGLAVSNLVAILLRGWGLRARLGGFDGRRVASTYSKAFVAAIAAGAVGVLIMAVTPDTFSQAGWGAVFASLGIVALAGAAMLATYVVAARVLRLSEVNELAASITKRVRRRVP